MKERNIMIDEMVNCFLCLGWCVRNERIVWRLELFNAVNGAHSTDCNNSCL